MAAASALAIVQLCTSANAQQLELRGEVQEERVNGQLFGATSATPQETPDGLDDAGGGPTYDLFTQSTLPEPASGQDERSQGADELFDELQPTRAATGAATPSTPARPTAPTMLGSTVEEPQTDTRSPIGQTPAAEDAGLVTGTVRVAPVDGWDEAEEDPSRIAPDSRREPPIGALSAPEEEEDPYAALGLRTGSFLLFPTLEQGLGWTSNGSTGPGGEDSFYSETALRLRAESDWSRHSASIEADGSYRRSLSGDEIDDPQGGVLGTLRLDLGSDYAAIGSAGYRIQEESASSPTALDDTSSSPLRHTFTGSLGLEKELGKLGFGVTGNVERDIYGDADLVDGGTLSQGDRDATLATVVLRGGYEISPALTPFVEGEFGRRVFDERRDEAGYERSAWRYSARAGTEIDLSDKLRGEIAAGWLWERPEDGRLDAIATPYLAAALAWSPQRGTTVELAGTTTVETATAAGETGSVLYGTNLSVTRQLRHNLTGTALAGLDWRDYVGVAGNEFILRGELGLTWWMNRYAGLTGRLSHERLESDLDGRSYDASSVYLGLTLQR